MPKIEIFRAGRHTAMSGQAIAFGAGDLVAAAAAYDPALHEAPLCVGHPAHDAPAYGWVRGLAVEGDRLVAEADQVDPAFAELVRGGRYKKLSAAFYAPDAPGNPKPGAYYLRHVGFLGAQPPAVKGLKAVAFGAADAGVLAFGDWEDTLVARLFRRLREYLLTSTDAETADRVLPADDVAALETLAAQPEPDDPTPTADGGMMTAYAEAQLAARRAELEAQEADIRRRTEALAEQERQARAAGDAAFVEAQIAAGRVLAVHKPGLVAFMGALHETGVLAFGEGEARTETPVAAWFRGWLEALPKAVEFAELAPADAALREADLSSDPTERAAQLAQRATKYQTEQEAAGRSVSFAEAVQHVTRTIETQA